MENLGYCHISILVYRVRYRRKEKVGKYNDKDHYYYNYVYKRCLQFSYLNNLRETSNILQIRSCFIGFEFKNFTKERKKLVQIWILSYITEIDTEE